MWEAGRGSAARTIAVALALAAGQHSAAWAESWSLIASVCADGDLQTLGEQYAEALVTAAQASGRSLALQLDNGEFRAARRLVRAGHRLSGGAPAAPSANSASAEALADLLRWARAEVPADRYAVVIFGHGTSASGRGWNGEPIGAWPALAIDRSAGGDLLRPAEVAEAVETGLGGRAGIVLLDCCYGASLEAVWGLRGAAELVIASPGRLRSSGVAWDRMLGAPGEAERPEDLARIWAESAGQSLTVVRTDRLEGVRESLARMCALAVAGMPQVAPQLTRARSGSPRWGAEGEMCDLRALCLAMANGSGGEIRDAAAETVAALDGCVVSGGGQRGRGAVTVPFAAGFGSRWPQVEPDGFTELSGWSALTRAYRDRLRDLMHRTYDDRRHDGAAT